MLDRDDWNPKPSQLDQIIGESIREAINDTLMELGRVGSRFNTMKKTEDLFDFADNDLSKPRTAWHRLLPKLMNPLLMDFYKTGIITTRERHIFENLCKSIYAIVQSVGEDDYHPDQDLLAIGEAELPLFESRVTSQSIIRLERTWEKAEKMRPVYPETLKIGSNLVVGQIYQARFDTARQTARALLALSELAPRNRCFYRPLALAMQAIAYEDRRSDPASVAQRTNCAYTLFNSAGDFHGRTTVLLHLLKNATELAVNSSCYRTASRHFSRIEPRIKEISEIAGDTSPNPTFIGLWIWSRCVEVEINTAWSWKLQLNGQVKESQFSLDRAHRVWDALQNYQGTKPFLECAAKTQLLSKYYFTEFFYLTGCHRYDEAVKLGELFISSSHFREFKDRLNRIEYGLTAIRTGENPVVNRFGLEALCAVAVNSHNPSRHC